MMKLGTETGSLAAYKVRRLLRLRYVFEAENILGCTLAEYRNLIIRNNFQPLSPLARSLT